MDVIGTPPQHGNALRFMFYHPGINNRGFTRNFMKWETVIGLETHVQLSTESKIFSDSSTQVGACPNTQANAIDLALPGTLPVMNQGAVERAIRFGLAVGASISPCSVFARKNYFYPDLPKNYQISQYEIPIVLGGKVSFFLNKEEKTIQLTRAHLEEDAGKSLHEDFNLPNGARASGIDLNRAGTPLLEIVTEPDMRSAAEAVAYARQLHALVVWLGICDGNMQEGSFRMDANVSVRPIGQSQLGTRAEIKNVNSFRFLERAILFEAQRQIECIEEGETVVQETRLYDADRDETRSMRVKEDAHDYRYFPDPDLPPLVISNEWIEKIRVTLPELPDSRRHRFVNEFGLTPYDAAQITADRELSNYFEAVAQALPSGQAKLAANWILGEMSAHLNRDNQRIIECPVSTCALATLINRIIEGVISNKIAREVFSAMWNGEANGQPDAIIQARGLEQINDINKIGLLIDQVINENPLIVADYQAGKQKAFNSLIGQIMKAARGQANPQQVNELLEEKLKIK